ncbi:site-specific DNA-methyltransferase [Nitratifractor sp.]
MERVGGSSMDIVAENIEKLRELFPDIFTEGKIDLEALQATLGEYIDKEDERYSFTWKGKARARRIAQTPSTGTLRPAPEESKEWENTQNLYIEGDNLEVLKLLQKSYHKKVKMIYIDPPYNTGKDFVYKDNFKDNLQNYLRLTNQVDAEGRKLSTNAETSGRYHSDWLNMIYPRLKLARNLLRDDGVIFISIDDNEVANLRKVCDEIFGEENFVADVIWEKKFSPQNDSKWFSDNHDFILVYAKNKEKWKINKLPRSEVSNNRFSNPDNDPRGVWASSDMTVKTYNEKYDYPITTPSGKQIMPTKGRCWSVSKDKFEELIKDNRVWFGKSGNNVPRLKTFLSELTDGIVPLTIWQHKDVGHNQEARQETKALFATGLFDSPKPTRLIKRILQLSTNKDDLILDFFSGSATTAHAVMQLNAEDGSNRRYILVQLPEPTDEKSEAYKAGYRTIAEIGKERIRRAGEKIKEENADKEGIEKLDIGFKVFKLDSSNIKAWDPDYENLEQSLLESVDNIKEDRTEANLLYEILLKYGINLAVPIEELEIMGKKVYNVGGNLVICLDKQITLDIVEEIAKLNERFGSEEPIRVVFRDNGFADAEVKTNAIQILKQYGVEDVRSL